MKEPQDNGEEHSGEAPLLAETESFGTWLRRQREVREIDLREIADSSKVSMSYLRAFEEDRFDVLPAPLFAKGFLRQYARYVGLDPEEVVNFYLAARQPEDEEASLQPRTEPEQPTRNYLFFVLTVTAALVLLVWLLSVFGERASRTSPSSSPGPAPESVTRELDPGDPADAETDPAAAEPASTDPLPEQVEPAPADPEPTQAAKPGPPLRVTLDFLSDCWVEASVDGAEKLSELKVQGESLLLDAQELVEFKVGDVDAVQVEVNGLPFEIESRSGTSVRNVRIDLETVATIAAGAPPPTAAIEDVEDGPRSDEPGEGE